MKNVIITAILLLVYIHSGVTLNAQTKSNRLTINNSPNKYWYVGVINNGHMMPIDNNYEADMYGDNYGNQIQPLLLSNQGDVIWCDDPIKISINDKYVTVISHGEAEVMHFKAGNTLKEAHQYAAKTHFECSGKTPDENLFLKPQYNTWIELIYNQNEKDILNYANGILENNFPPGVLMIDDNWQENYGKWDFHPGRFSNPKAMISELHSKGFKVMLWVCPFVSADSDVYRELEVSELLLKNENGLPKMVRWWNGVSALLDFTNPAAVEWFTAQLDYLMEEYSVDGFKFDAGDTEYYNDVKAFKDVTPNEHTKLFAEIGLKYPLNEYRANWKMGGEPIANRLRDKGHSWEALNDLIPNMIVEGLMGYAYSCPDMIGGGEFTAFLDDAILDQELIVRSAQCHALMPMMQFSVAPWRVLDTGQLAAVHKAVAIREHFIDYIMSVVRESKVQCTPILRPLDYSFPNKGYEQVKNQFMIGEKLLVAPVMEKGVAKHKVVIPLGKWKGYDGRIYNGPKSYKLSVEMSDIPYFEKID